MTTSSVGRTFPSRRCPPRVEPSAIDVEAGLSIVTDRDIADRAQHLALLRDSRSTGSTARSSAGLGWRRLDPDRHSVGRHLHRARQGRKSLLIGEPAHSDLSRSILDIARRSPGVLRANGVLTVQLSPAEVVAALSVEFADDKRADDIEQ
ncbi:hypothetical protein ACVJMY_004760 [Bradyrhizobium diazoefficiens]